MPQTSSARRLTGQRICVTGRLSSMSRAEAIALIEEEGGAYVELPDRETDVLVVGDEGWPLRADGSVTRSLRRAHELEERGEGPEIVSETVWLAGLGLGGGRLERHYTLQQLARILGVEVPVIRGWMRRGWIRPVKTSRRLAWFDFQQVAGARRIQEMLSDGVKPARLEESLRQMQRWLPDAPQSVHPGLERDGQRLLVRLPEGGLADSRGQLFLEFREGVAEPPADAIPMHERGAEDWFALGLQWDEEGRLEDAIEAWHQVLRHDGIAPEAAFNMGNALYRLGRVGEACQRYLQATEQDEEYVEAWNNLGNVLSELGREEAALEALRRAVQLAGPWPDPHFNLAETLHQAGQTLAAIRHWQRYVELDPHSPWADRARARLRDNLRGGDAG